MNNKTLEKMCQLRLYGMYDAFKTNPETTVKESLTPDQFVALLIASEYDDRKNRSIERAIRLACFRYKASLEQLDYTIERRLEKNQVHRLAELKRIERIDLLILDDFTAVKSCTP